MLQEENDALLEKVCFLTPKQISSYSFHMMLNVNTWLYSAKTSRGKTPRSGDQIPGTRETGEIICYLLTLKLLGICLSIKVGSGRCTQERINNRRFVGQLH